MKRLVLLLLNLLMPMILFAASNDLCFRHFSVEDGLSSNSVRALMQDKYGFLWIGTDEGLNRYDGTTVKLYRLKDRGANEAISSLYISSSCNLAVSAFFPQTPAFPVQPVHPAVCSH